MKLQKKVFLNDLESFEYDELNSQYDVKIYDEILDYVEENFNEYNVFYMGMIAECIYCYSYLKSKNTSDMVIADTLTSMKMNYKFTLPEKMETDPSAFWNRIRECGNIFIDKFVARKTEKTNINKRINIKKNIAGKIINRKIHSFSSKYYTEAVIDMKKFYTKEDVLLLEKLGIDVKDNLYTGEELEHFSDKLYAYYADDSEMSPEDMEYVKDLNITGVTKEEYYNLLDKRQMLYDYYIC